MRLNHLVLTLSERCNFACAQCFGGYGPKGKDMALGHALNCIELAARQKVDAVFLTGGEPTLHHGYLTCIEKSVSLGLYTVLCSNCSFEPGELRDMREAGLQEIHVCYDKFRAPYISTDKVKQIIDGAEALGIRPVLIIIEANSYHKYQDVLGDYYRYCIPDTPSFQPIVNVGRAVGLPISEFESDIPLLVSKKHGFGIFVQPDGRVSFCPLNDSFASTTVDLASDWLAPVVDTFSRDPTVQLLVNEGVSGLLRRVSGIPQDDWASPFFQCNLCLDATQKGTVIIGGAINYGR